MIVLVVFFHWLLPSVLSQSDGAIRLVDTKYNFSDQGRVEIYHVNSWGTICDDYWGVEESDVVCKQLGYTKGAQYWYTNAFFGEGSGKIWMDDVRCFGNETSLTQCHNIGWNGHNCHHYEDVGVVCQPKGHVSENGNCSFEKGHGMCGYENDKDDDFDWVFGSRNIESYRQGPRTDHTTANTTGDGFYLNIPFTFFKINQGDKARLLSPVISSGSAHCLQFYYFMGGTYVGELIVYVQKGGKPVWQLIGDQGREWKKGVTPLHVKDKNFQIIFEGIAGTGYYGSDVSIDDISVTADAVCKLSPPSAKPSPPVTPTKAIRLTGTKQNITSAGRVEVFHKGKWGTVCGYQFDIKAAHVVCKELGYEGAEMVVPCCDVFGKGTKVGIWMDNVKCIGTEPSITMCPHSGWGKTYCSHDADVAVICKTKETDKTEFDVQLINDEGVDFKGRVEVKIGGLWGTVSDSGWDIFDANVVCKQKNFGGAVGAYSGSSFGAGKGPIWMSNFQCKGSETSLAKCSFNSTEVHHDYRHYWDASVECYDLRLVGGETKMSGRVEVRYAGYWGTVCDHGWNINAANVVCRQLGYRRAESPSCCAEFGTGTGQIFLDQVQCKGDEPSLSFCRHMGWTAHNCSHQNDAGVYCTNAICSKSNPCLNGGTCSESSGTCTCKPHYVGETCDISIENNTVKVSLDGKLDQLNLTLFKQKMVKDLNIYCATVNCSAVLSKGEPSKLTFQVQDVITEDVKRQDNGVLVVIALLHIGETTEVFPKQFMYDFISKSGDKLAGYKVITVDGRDEGAPAGHHSNQSKPKSNRSKYIYIGVGVAVGLIALLVLIFIVKRYGRMLGVGSSGQRPSSYSDQSYVALNTEAYDDDSALLRPQPDDDRDLIS